MLQESFWKKSLSLRGSLFPCGINLFNPFLVNDSTLSNNAFVASPRQCLESEDDLQQLQSDGVPSEVTDWLASTFTQRVRRPARRPDEKPKFRSIVHAVQAGIFVER